MNIVPRLRVVASPDPERGSITDLFHRVNKLLPDDQDVTSVPPNTRVAEALKIMQEKRYSQLPVVEGTTVLGVFSYRSFALGIYNLPGQTTKPEELTVEDFLEQLPSAHVHDEFEPLIEHLNRHDAVLIGGPERLQGILTPMDLLAYLYEVANAFVLLEEIELVLRALIAGAVTQEELIECVRASLGHLYKEAKLPQRLEEMTFDNYKLLVCHGENWKKFERAFGGTRQRMSARVHPVCELRNDVFHFKREITVEDHQKLADFRDWLLSRARLADARMKGGRHE